MNLLEYASKTECPICTSPFREEIEQAWGVGIRATTITNWLIFEKGVEVMSTRKVRTHFESGHVGKPQVVER